LDLTKGARTAVRTCMNVTGADRVFIIRTRTRASIADAIEREVRETGAACQAWTMEDHVKRPASEFPRALADEITRFRPTVSFFVGDSQLGELAFRIPMRRFLVDQLNLRHAHMIDVTEEVMTDGMTADYDEIYRVTHQVYELARQAHRIAVSTVLGTDVAATFSPHLKWIPCDGRYWEPGRWGNLPEGETFTCPQSVDGVIAAEEMGDWFTAKYGLLATPARLVVKGGRFMSIETPDERLATDFRQYMAQHPNSSRVGEFAIGTNVGLTRIICNFLQDEKFPGVHIAFGDPYGHETGADWDAPSHVDVLASHATVTLDGQRLMENGRFLV
jgi:leucyl aminopeptidase (aminopeptidase T)